MTHEKMLVSDLDVSPDGKQVAFIYRRENARNQGNLAELGLARLDDGKLVRLTENAAPESRVKWNPNGREIGYLAPDDTNWELKQSKLFVIDMELREPRMVSGQFEGDISDYVWSSDGARALLSAGVKTNRGIFELDISGQDVQQLVEKQGSAGDVSFSADGGKAAFVWSSAVHPPDVFSTSLPGGSELNRLSDANPHFRDKVMGN